MKAVVRPVGSVCAMSRMPILPKSDDSVSVSAACDGVAVDPVIAFG